MEVKIRRLFQVGLSVNFGFRRAQYTTRLTVHIVFVEIIK